MTFYVVTVARPHGTVYEERTFAAGPQTFTDGVLSLGSEVISYISRMVAVDMVVTVRRFVVDTP